MPVATAELTGGALLGVSPHPMLQSMMTGKVRETVHLGRIRPKAMPPCPRLDSYVFQETLDAAPLPAATNWRAKAQGAIARMYLNDRLGCCVIAGKFHATGVWTANDAGAGVQGTDQEVQSQYVGICGPGDRGCVITNVLDVMRTRGLMIGGKLHTIDGYVAVDWTNQQLVKAVQFLFGASTIGINLPQAWTQNAVWDVTESPIVGGHDVTPIDYSDEGVYVASWGRLYLITWAAWLQRRWLEEMYCLLASDWYGNDKLAPCGIDAVTLRADLMKLARSEIPDLNPPAPVPPQPPPQPAPYKAVYFTPGTFKPGETGSYKCS